MDNKTRKKLLKTAGWITIAVGVYLVYKGSDHEIVIDKDNVIDAEFEIIE